MRTFSDGPERAVDRLRGTIGIVEALDVTSALTILHLTRWEERVTVVVALVMAPTTDVAATLRYGIVAVPVAGSVADAQNVIRYVRRAGGGCAIYAAGPSTLTITWNARSSQPVTRRRHRAAQFWLRGHAGSAALILATFDIREFNPRLRVVVWAETLG